MQNKRTNRWLDAQILIASLAMAISLALWNLLAGSNRSNDAATAAQNKEPAPQAQSLSSLPPTKIFLGGSAPGAPATITTPRVPRSAPPPIAVTGSSRP